MIETGLISREGRAVPLLGLQVKAEVLGGHTRVRLRQHYKNAEAKPIEAVYTFPLPSDAVLSGFAMICEGRRLDGVVQDRDEAFRKYDEAILHGHGAALLEQERPNVFTASVGNLLPHEETLIELEYLQRLTADEGVLRWMLPTAVAPRYVPGTPQGDRTGGGWADPTDLVPDADRVTPLIGDAPYGLALDLTFAIDAELEVTSPSHTVSVTHEDGRVRVRFARPEVALDRDVVIVARNARSGSIAGVTAHRAGDEPGFFAVTVVPDLFDPHRAVEPQRIVFVIDTSGSMDGASLPEAQSALRLCLRHLRDGDQFDIIAFNNVHQELAPGLQPFSQESLNQADRWIGALRASGGTEMATPLLRAVKMAPGGIVVLLTDGQVANEHHILRLVEQEKRAPRFYSFGIGTNVSDYLLRELGRRTGGGVEFIHPGERIDEKVTGTFSRAIAPRVQDVEVKFAGVEAGELAPSTPPALVDGEPWTLFGRYPMGATGQIEIKGLLRGEPFRLEIPVSLPAESSQPGLKALWAAERIRDLQSFEIGPRRADPMRERITKLSKDFGVSSPFTSFLVVETREGQRRATGQPETRFIPIHTPAGWAMFDRQRMGGQTLGGAPRGFSYSPKAASVTGQVRAAFRAVASAGDASPAPPTDFIHRLVGASAFEAAEAKSAAPAPIRSDPTVDLLSRQLASGLWGDAARSAGDPAQLRASVRALLELLRAGLTTSHPVHGAQIRKAIDAVIPVAIQLAEREQSLVELALSVAWLLASGERTRRAIGAAVMTLPVLEPLAVRFEDEAALREEVEAAAV